MSWRRPRAYATLARVRHPATGRLNSGVRRQKSVFIFFGRNGDSSASVAAALRISSRPVASSVSSSGALTCCMRCAWRLRKRRSSSVCWLHLIRCFGGGRLKIRGARSSTWASVFGRLARVSPSPASFPPNKSFKPTPCRGGSRVLCATLARVRRPATGRLNSSVRR